MVVCLNMIVDWFLPGGLPNAQQQVPPLPAPRGWKRPRNANQPSERLEDAPLRTPLTPTTATVTIRELVSSAHPPLQVGSNVASSSARLLLGGRAILCSGTNLLP